MGAPLEKVRVLSVCSTQDPPRHKALLGTAFFLLTLFVALYVLVYVECLVRRWLQALALFTWLCLMLLGSMLVWDSWKNEACAWEQVTVGVNVTGLGCGSFCLLVALGFMGVCSGLPAG